MKPPFTYFGGKTAIAPTIAAMLPKHEHYVEPFAGSLAVLLAKRQSAMETVNDLDGDLMNFWRVLRDDPEGLERACALTPHSRAEYLAARAAADDDLERARRTWIRLTQGRGGQLGKLTGWRFYQDPRGSHSSMPDYVSSYVGRICPAAARLARVSLECKPALDIIREYGRHEGTLIYADPPYLGTARAWNKGPAYSAEMRSEDHHRELAAVLDACRAAVVLSGYASPLYQDIYAGWHRTEIAAFNGNANDQRRTEVLWSNRPIGQPQLELAMPP